MYTFHIPYDLLDTEIDRTSLTPKKLHPIDPNTSPCSHQTSPTNSHGNELYKIDSTLAIDLHNISAPSQDIGIDIDEFKHEIDEIDHLIHAMAMDDCLQQNMTSESDKFAYTRRHTHPMPKSPSSTTRNKRKKKRQKRNHRYHDVGYDPHPQHRAQGNIQISKSLTENIIPNAVKERHLNNLYTFMDKSYALSLNMMHHDRIKIINYDLHAMRDNEVLYCVIARQDGMANKARGYKWRMANKLYTAQDLKMEYAIATDALPTTWRNTERFANELIAGDEIKRLLMDAQERERIINTCQWHKVNILNRVSNKRRMTLSMTKPEFIRQCTVYSNHLQSIHLMPILMFNKESNEYWIEHVWIVTVDDKMDIGISLRYNANHNGMTRVRVSGIHLDKAYLAMQHQLVLPQHECHCLDHFKSYISDLKIGNPDDLQNKINYYRQVIDELSSCKDEMREFLSVEPTMNNLYQFQSLQQRMYHKHRMQYSRSPSYSMNANQF